jgi:hypothetical protein
MMVIRFIEMCPHPSSGYAAKEDLAFTLKVLCDSKYKLKKNFFPKSKE